MGRRALGTDDINYYHVVSRVVDRRFIFGGAEKRRFRDLMGRLLAFTGIRCVTYCLMDNHFHLLLAVPDAEGKRFRERATARDVWERIGCLYSRESELAIRERYRALMGGEGRVMDAIEAEPLSERSDEGGRYLRTFLDRMYDLGSLMKELKGAFTQWYNRKMERTGTLWEERFRSVLCEGGDALAAIAAYIDLNPVRAGLISDPSLFRWSGYGEAVSGGARARDGIAMATRIWHPEAASWREVNQTYRYYLMGKKELAGKGGEPRIDRPMVAEWIHDRSGLLRVHVAAFTRGFAIGSQGFLEEVFAGLRDHFGPSRKSGSRKIPGKGWGGLMAMRDLRRRA